MPTVVILGAGPAGLTVAHKLLQTTTSTVPSLKIVLVTPSTHFYWNIASVRAIAPDPATPPEALFGDIATGFSVYKAGAFELVLGWGRGVDVAGNTVSVALVGEDGAQTGEKTVKYDHLVVATGASVAGEEDAGMGVVRMPFKSLGSYQATLDRLRFVGSEIEKASSILIVGGGSTAVETAGEIGERYLKGGEKKITLVTTGERLLPNLKPAAGKSAADQLAKLGVRVVTGTGVVGYDRGKGTVVLGDGETVAAGFYLQAFGVRPNGGFLPEGMVDEMGNMKIIPSFRAASSSSLSPLNVWGVGDVGNLEVKMAFKAQAQAVVLAGNLKTVLEKGEKAAVKEYVVDGRAMMFATIGRGGGTGEAMGWRVWAWVVAMVKGKNLFVDKMGGVVDGSGV